MFTLYRDETSGADVRGSRRMPVDLRKRPGFFDTISSRTLTGGRG